MQQSQVKVRLKVTPYVSDREQAWIQNVSATIIAGARQVGQVSAYLIQRTTLRRSEQSFHYYLDDLATDVPSTDVRQTAQVLFDKHGRLRRKVYGNFGPETDHGELLYINDVTLKPAYQGQGIGCTAIRQLMQKLLRAGGSTSWWFAVMHPDTCEDSWRPAGFRVLNRTKHLACCALEDHKCWNITDQVEPSPLCEDSADLSPGLDRDLEDAVRGAVYAHSNSEWAPRMLCNYKPVNLQQVQKLITDGADMSRARAVQCASSHDETECLKLLLKLGADINDRDSAGNTALHIVAAIGKPEAVKMLLSLGADPTVKDNQGYTALDNSITKMQTRRDILGFVGEPFQGHDADRMLIIDHFKAFYADPALLTSSPIPVNQYGCTCGADVSDAGNPPWLSPRLRYRLLRCAETAAEMASNSIDDIESWPCYVSNEEHGEQIWLFEYMPISLQRKVSLTFAKGWAALLAVIRDLLSASIVPTAKLLRQSVSKKKDDLHKAVGQYIKAKGRVEYALNAVINCSREEHELVGDGSFLDDKDTAAELQALPECANDDDYSLAQRMLCNVGFMPPGPNYDSNEEQADNEEDAANQHLYNPLPMTSRGMRELQDRLRRSQMQ